MKILNPRILRIGISAVHHARKYWFGAVIL